LVLFFVLILITYCEFVGIVIRNFPPYKKQSALFHVLSEKHSVESREISEGVVLDYDADGALVGIDIDNASTKVHLKELILRKLPADIKAVA
jgi:uncharacterized protein YuzE